MNRKQILQITAELEKEQPLRSFVLTCFFLEQEEIAEIKRDLQPDSYPEGSVGRLNGIAVLDAERIPQELSRIPPPTIDCYRGIRYGYVTIFCLD